VNAFSPAQAIITAMITPALLILASGSLIATVLVRLARIVDRLRKLGEAHESTNAAEIDRHERRALLAERALTFFFSAITCFVLAGFAIVLDRAASDVVWLLPVLIVSAGMALIVAGCAAMLAETRLAVGQIKDELARLRAR
jgi:hypothetical protein